MNKDSPFLYQGGNLSTAEGDGAGAGAPAYPRFVGAALHVPGVCAGLVAPAPTMQALRESMAKPCSAPRVTFSPMRKSPKNLPEGDTPSGYSPWGALSSPQRRQAPLPPERGETPGSMQKPNPPAAPRIDSRGCDPRCSLGRNKDRLAHKLKVANQSRLVAESSPARCAASAKRAVRDGYSFQFNGFCVPSLEPDFVRFPKFC